jgi:hypothetical protein
VRLDWNHVDGVDVVKVSPCTAATVTIAGNKQTYGPFITPASTACNPHDASIAVYRFILGRMLAGTVTWRIHGSKLTLNHRGVGRMVLTKVR